MKTKELKKIARENGYEFRLDGIDFLLERKIAPSEKFKNIIKISRYYVNRIWIKSCGYADDADVNMMEVSIAYAKTSLEDREGRKMNENSLRRFIDNNWPQIELMIEKMVVKSFKNVVDPGEIGELYTSAEVLSNLARENIMELMDQYESEKQNCDGAFAKEEDL